jgi:hypothetical protein
MGENEHENKWKPSERTRAHPNNRGKPEYRPVMIGHLILLEKLYF